MQAGRSSPFHAPTLTNFFLQPLSALAASPFCAASLNTSYAWDAGFSKTPPYSNDGRPDLSWLPRSPSATSPSLLSEAHTRSASRQANVTMRACPPQPSRMPFRPDPNGITPPPLLFPWGARPDSFLPLHQVTSVLFEEYPLSSVLCEGDPYKDFHPYSMLVVVVHSAPIWHCFHHLIHCRFHGADIFGFIQVCTSPQSCATSDYRPTQHNQGQAFWHGDQTHYQ